MIMLLFNENKSRKSICLSAAERLPACVLSGKVETQSRELMSALIS